jgi:hypothetical protein
MTCTDEVRRDLEGRGLGSNAPGLVRRDVMHVRMAHEPRVNGAITLSAPE